MKLLSEQEYLAFYQKYGRCIDDVSPSSKPLTNSKLLSKFQRYIQKEERKKERQKIKFKQTNDEWQELRGRVIARDNNECQFLKLSKNEFGKEMTEAIITRAGRMINQLDLAHIFPRSTHPELRLEEDNCVMLNRYCHSLLDKNISPITLKEITTEERLSFFFLMMPKERLKRLETKMGRTFDF